jgi:hypothetical protein
MKLKPLVIAVAALTCSGVAFAGSSQAQVAQELKAVSKEMSALQHQVASLQGQVTSLKRKLHNANAADKAQDKATAKHEINKALAKRDKMREHFADFGTSVVTGPFTEKPTHYDGSQLLINTPSINGDVKLLRRRVAENKARAKYGLPPITKPHLVLSGSVQAIAQAAKPYSGKTSSDIDLTTAQMDFFAEVDPWVSGFMSFAYDNDPNSLSANRIDNSKVALDEGYITIGNLEKSSFYGSVGQMDLPFGRYSSSMVSDPVTEFVGKTKARAIVVGYHPYANDMPFGEAYVFHSASNNSNDRINGFGFQGGYKFQLEKTTGTIGAGFINNIADAEGFQSTGYGDGYFKGFNTSSAYEAIDQGVPGLDLHASFGFGPLIFLTEYVTAMRRFSSNNLTFDNDGVLNGPGARPAAFNAEATYLFKWLGKPMTFTLNYASTHQALGINLPRQRYGATYQVTLTKDMILDLELLHNINYGKSARATGEGLPAYVAKELGHGSNTLTAQLGIYF